MKCLSSLIISMFLVQSLFAQSADEAVNLIENEQGFGIRAAAMGRAYTAVADDYSAIYWNPAGLAQMDYGQVSGSLYHNTFENNSAYLGLENNDDRSFTKLQHLGIVYPFPVVRGAFTIALGYQKINSLDFFSEFGGFLTQSNDFTLEYDNGDVVPFDQNIQQNYSIFKEGGIDQWSFAAAMDLSANFSAGLTLSFYGGNSTYNFDYTQTDIDDNYNVSTGLGYDFYSYDYHQRIIADYSGFEAKLGGLFHLSDNLKLGTVITFPMSLTVDEEWSEDDAIEYDDFTVDAYDLGSGSFDYIIKVPFKFDFGLSYTNDKFTVSTSVDYRDWSQLKYEVPDGRDASEYDDLLLENSIIRDDYQSVLGYSLGGEFKIGETGLMLRAGYRNSPSPKKSVGSEFDKKFYSAGLGYRVDPRTTLNFSYTQGNWKRESDYIYSGQTAAEDITNTTILFGLDYHF